MSKFQTLLLDIEGTVCPISFVKDVLFPYAKTAAAAQIPPLASHFPLPATVPASEQDNELLKFLVAFPEAARESPDALIAHINKLIDSDIKDSALKSLQGYLWNEGYVTGQVKAPVYQDAIAAIKKYAKELSRGVSIYSSGSVKAQILLFKYTQDGGDLTSHLTSYFDTVNAGSKIIKESYNVIAKELGLEKQPESILFLSDNPKEVDAAIEAGFSAYIVVRPGNAPLPEGAESKYKVITTLDNII